MVLFDIEPTIYSDFDLLVAWKLFLNWNVGTDKIVKIVYKILAL